MLQSEAATTSFSKDVEEESIGQMAVCNKPRSKLKHSRTAAPMELLLMNILVTMVHLLSSTSYLSTEFNELEPSFPPSERKFSKISLLLIYALYPERRDNFLRQLFHG